MNNPLTYAFEAGALKRSRMIILVFITGIAAVSSQAGIGKTSLPNHYRSHRALTTSNVVCGVEMQDSVVGYIKSNTNNQVFYLLTITNTGTARDSFSFSKSTSGTLLYSYVETIDGAELLKTPGIEPGGSYSFIIRFVVPNGSPAQTTNYTNLVASSSVCGSSGTDTTHLLTHLYSGKVSTGDSCDIQITKTASSGSVTSGDSITYTISLINNLPGLAKDVFVNDTLASSLVYGSATITKLPISFGYSLSYNSTSHVVQFRALTALQQSQPITFKITVKAVCTAIPSVTNKVLVSSSTYDNKASNDTSSVTTNVTTAFSAPVAKGITNCYNSTASLTASGAGPGTGYQWYSASSGGSLLYTGQNYTTPVLNSSGTYYVGYYDLDTSTCTGPRTAVAVTVTTAPTVSSPSGTTVCPNDAATFTESATGTSLTYQWQVSTNSGSTWNILTDISPYSGVTSSTLAISSASYAMNGYQYRCNVASGGCTNTISSAAATLTVRKSYTWLGVNTDWDDPVNWCSGVPDSASDVTIPSGLTNYPIITGTASTHDIYTGCNTTVTLDSGTIRIFGTVTNNGLYDARTGTVMMKGSAPQTIAGSIFTGKTILNLVDANTSSSGLSVASTFADTLKISGTLSFGTDSSKLNTGDNIDLLSTASATANVSVVHPGNIISGDAIVDRYINTGNLTDQHPKSWQFLSTPTRGQTIRQSWMENGNNAPGYGTRITSPWGDGFDAHSMGVSIKTYNPVNNNWDAVINGNDTLYNINGYMLFIRGDRTVTNAFAAPNTTILRSKGQLLTGSIGTVTVSPGHYQSVGNPYASVIDFTHLSKGSDVDNKFYIWDPYLGGTYGYGGYQTLSEVNDWKPVPGGTLPYNSNVPNATIQSGQAFFVYSTGTASLVNSSGSISFTEDCKVDGNTAVNFSRKASTTSVVKSFLRASLFREGSSGFEMADGNSVAFAPIYNNKVDRDDALKIPNGGENFGILRDGKVLSVEARQQPSINDTLFYYISNVLQQNHQVRFAPENWQDFSLQPLFYDSYLNTRTPLSLTDSTFINVSFNSDPASRASGRFMVVFRQLSNLPVSFISLNTAETPSGIVLNWIVNCEDGLNSYEIEFSNDALHFKTFQTIPVDPQNKGNYTLLLGIPESGNNFYRIRSKTLAGEALLSPVQKIYVPFNPGDTSITVAPNPLENGLLRLYFANEPRGNYHLRLVNSSGQTVYSGRIDFAGGSGFIQIAGDKLTRGTYRAELLGPDNKKVILNVVY